MPSRKQTAREVLNELKWREGMDLGRAEIWYADRIKPEGYKVIQGNEITKLGKGYFYVEDSMLPYYKIKRIVYNDKILFDRDRNLSKTAK